jgi:hypothetical protein
VMSYRLALEAIAELAGPGDPAGEAGQPGGAGFR